MFKLYELTEMYNNVIDLLGDDDSDKEQIEKALASINENIEQKAENMAKLIKSIESNAKVLKEEEIRLATKRRRLENQIGNIKGYLESQLKEMDLKKIQGNLFTVALQNNPPSVKCLDGELIPEIYKKEITEVKILKKPILDALKAGEEVPGTEMVQTQSLRIR